MCTAIANASVFSQSWDLLYTVVSGNITDPSSRNKKWIYSSYPDPQKAGFGSFPIVTISPVESPDTNTYTFGLNRKKVMLTSDLMIFSKRSVDLDTISDDVHDAILTKQADFSASGLNHLNIKSAGQGTDILNDDTKIHFKGFTVEMEFNR